MRARSTCTRGLLLVLAAVTWSGSSWAQPLPGADDGTRNKPAPKKPVEGEKPTDEEPAPSPPGHPAAPGEQVKPAAEPSDDADAEEVSEGPDPSRPPPLGKGAVWGVVKSKASDETLLEAVVSVIGRKESSTTDTEGRYRLELPPGTYQLRVVYELHKPARLRNVVVQAGRVNKIDVALQHDETAVEEVTAIEAEAERASAATQLMLRKNATHASDSIGAQDIAKTPDRNAADAVKRVVGTTVVDGKYIFVRGLGDRYTNSLLNGSPLPSPEPDRQAVPLDMFPSLVISDLTISKTFVPDMPGDFAGGSLNIHTRDMPNKFLFQGTLGIGANTQSTFGHRLSQPSGKYDWLGIDSGGRQLPSEVPGRKIQKNDEEIVQAGRAINGPMQTQRAFNLPHGSASVVVGDSFKLGKQRVLGYIAGVSYSRKFQMRQDEIIRTYGIDPTSSALARWNDYRAETGIDTVTWSGLGTVSYAFNNDHKIALTGLYSRNSDREGRIISGFNDEQANNIRDERIRFVNRDLSYGQLRGEHRFRSLNTAELKWTALLTRAQLQDPNMRETVYVADGENGFAYREGTQSGQHFYAKQTETTKSGGLDWTQPLSSRDGAPKLKFGGLATLRDRKFDARRFRFLRNNNGVDPAVFRQSPNQLFVDDNVGDGFDGRPLKLEEWTSPTDSYVAQYNVYAGYLMADVPITSKLRVVLGERVEGARQTLQSFDKFAATPTISESSRNNTDILPSGNIIYKVTADSNVRLSATQTVARPQLRELAPFIFTDFFGAREHFGNPDLERTRIVNLDARYEIFPRVSEVLALTVFHKRFNKPIETTIIPTGRGIISYQNAKGAVNTGVELEGRKGLDFIPGMKEFSVLGNVTFVHSRVELDPAAGGIQTSSERPLAGQSPYVVNAAIDWNHEKTKTRFRALYNTSGRRVAQVGQSGLPDVYEQPRHIVDLSVAQSVGEHVDLKATVENLFNSPVRFTQGEDGTYIVQRYSLGSTFWLMATYSH
jgi:TonB dependent receptor/Carboxypeptidase regulatory-like domain/TonB-dependent Receptor Plug Domain